METLKKVKNIYYDDNTKNSSTSGLFIELESGEIYRHQTTDSIIAFERIKELPKNNLISKEKIEKIVAEKNERELVSKKEQYFSDISILKNTIGQIDSLMEQIYKLRPDLRPKIEDTRPKKRPANMIFVDDAKFNFDAVDDLYNQVMGK